MIGERIGLGEDFMNCETDKEQEEFEEESYLDDDLYDFSAPRDYNGLEPLILRTQGNDRKF